MESKGTFIDKFSATNGMNEQNRQIITSNTNDKVRFVRKLWDKKYREESGLFVLEGVNLVRDLPLAAGVSSFFVTEERELEFAPVFARFPNAEVNVVTKTVFSKMAETESPYGVLAVVKIPQSPDRAPRTRAVLLDGVRDCGNLGTIIRTLVACGFSELYLLDCADAFSGKTVRATLGGIFKLDTICVDEVRALELCTQTQSFVLDMDGENLFSCNVSAEPLLLVAGSEAHGVRPSIVSACKKVVSIPMQNIESLNVATAVAVAAYEINYGRK